MCNKEGPLVCLVCTGLPHMCRFDAGKGGCAAAEDGTNGVDAAGANGGDANVDGGRSVGARGANVVWGML